jgi:threonine dehydratase
MAKLALIERQGASIRLAGNDFDHAKVEARAFAAAEGLPFFEDGNEPAQWEGYRSIAREIWEQCPETPSAVVVPVGNGALIAGVGMEVRERSAAARVDLIGVVAKSAPVMALSFDARTAVPCDRMDTFADGLAVRVAVARAVEVVNRVVDQFVLVSEREIARALDAFAAAGIRTEGAAAAALAALPKIGETTGSVVLIVTGSNIDEELFQRARTASHFRLATPLVVWSLILVTLILSCHSYFPTAPAPSSVGDDYSACASSPPLGIGSRARGAHDDWRYEHLARVYP